MIIYVCCFRWIYIGTICIIIVTNYVFVDFTISSFNRKLQTITGRTWQDCLWLESFVRSIVVDLGKKLFTDTDRFVPGDKFYWIFWTNLTEMSHLFILIFCFLSKNPPNVAERYEVRNEYINYSEYLSSHITVKITPCFHIFKQIVPREISTIIVMLSGAYPL